MTPKCFSTTQWAKKHRKHIVLPEGNDDRIIITSRLLSMDVVDITILGSKKQIENKVAELGIAFDFSKVKLLVRLNLSIMKIT
jgi:phosphate acetyltransferase